METGKIKDDTEIFKELIEIFKPRKIEFKEFDYFKWQLKRLKDKIIIDEKWKEIENSHYSISNYGRVRNDKNNKIKQPRFRRWIWEVDIYEKGTRYTVNVKRMVVEYFVRKLKDGERVSYIDGDNENNYYKNLKIVSK